MKDDKPGDILSPPLATVKIEPLEPISIKEEKELDESMEVSLKLEPLPWDESADLKVSFKITSIIGARVVYSYQCMCIGGIDPFLQYWYR